MRTKKLLALVCAVAMLMPCVTALQETDVSAAEKTTIVDEMKGAGWAAPIEVPLSGKYSANMYLNTDFSDADFFGEGGDTTGWRLKPVETNGYYIDAYSEYTVAGENINKVSAEYYWLENNGSLPYIKVDLKHDRLIDDPADYVRSTFAVSEVAGNDVVFKWIDKETGAVYAKINGVWFLYCDEVINTDLEATVGGGYYRWVRTKGIWGFDFPDESKLVPYGGGFEYTLDGVTWTWATPTIESSTLNAAGNKNKEIWSAEIPTNAMTVRAHLSDRSKYLVAHNPMWDSGGGIRPSFSVRDTGCVGWYCGISKVVFDVQEQAPVQTGKVLVGYAKDGKLYSSAYVAANAGEYEEVFVDFGMKDGASIRLEDPTGIRFRSELVKADYDAVVAYVGAANVKLGMRVVRGGTSYLDIPASNTAVEAIESVDHVVFNGVIINIAKENYNVTYCGTGYMDVTFEDGATERIYAVAGDNTRTVAQVAKMIYDEDNSLTQLKKYFEEVA